MSVICVIAGREVRSSFVTPLAYVVMTGYAVLSGFFFFGLLSQFNANLRQAVLRADFSLSLNEWVIEPYLHTIEIVLLFLIPLLTMRAVADERASGTFELVATSPVSTTAIVWGKFIGLSVVVSTVVLLSLVYPVVLWAIADVEGLPIVVGSLGIVLFSLALTAVGIGISACTQYQMIAGVVTMIVFLLFYSLSIPAAQLSGRVADVLFYLSPGQHTEFMIKGVFESVDVVYFASVIALGLFFAMRVLDGQRWR